MKKIACMLLLIQSGFIMAQTKTVITQNGEKVTIHPNANNGLTANNGFIQLGGALTQPSVLTTTSAFTLALKGLQTGSSTDNVVVTDANGVLKTVSRASIVGTGDNLGNHTATQDLEMSNKNINNINTAVVKNDLQIYDRTASNTALISIAKKDGIFGFWNTNKNVNTLTINDATNNIGIGIGSGVASNVLHIKGTNPLRVEGLQKGAMTDNILTTDSNGVVRTLPLGTEGQVLQIVNNTPSWVSMAGTWMGLLTNGIASTNPSIITFSGKNIIGGNGTITNTSITVPVKGLYEFVVTGHTLANASPYLTTWEVKKNGVTFWDPHYAAPDAGWGTFAGATYYQTLEAGDVITLFLSNKYGGGVFRADTVNFSVKLIQY